MGTIVTLRIKRSKLQDDYRTYTVPFFEGITLLTALRYIKEQLDPTLGFRNNHCGRGVCTTCLVKVDGKNVRACCCPLTAGAVLTVEPANAKVIKDLAVEL